jgi:adenosylmethionine---8-amino-7-oxononanoate aminotransferase
MLNEQPPIAITRGEGALLYDVHGKAYIDAISSWWVNLHGHSHPHIAEKVSAQLRTLEHVIFAGFTHSPAVELAEKLAGKLPGDQRRIFYSDNGSTAVEVAIKMALQYWVNRGEPRNKVIALKGAYHGDTFGAMSVSGRSAFTAAFEPFLFDVEFIDVPSKGKFPAALDQMSELLQKHGNNIAAFIFEPLVQGASGMIMYEEAALEALMGLCRESRVLLIADEVMTGFGRTGRFFATDHLSEKPDIYCLSKGLTGGTMALGATSCTEEIYAAFLSKDKLKTFFHGHSFTANPLACSAGLASMELMEKKETWEAIREIESMHSEFSAILNTFGIKDVRQKGTILAIELETGEDTSYFNRKGASIYRFFLDRGILLRPLGNIIYILPPYCIKKEELEQVYNSITEFLTGKE